MGLIFNKGVRLDPHEEGGIKREGIQPPAMMAILAVAKICSDVLRKDCVVTSVNEGTHGADSLHYKGLAVDFRVKHLDSPATKEFLVLLVKVGLNSQGEMYDVLLEDPEGPNQHLHVEYDPE